MGLAKQVISQTERRVLKGEKVPPEDKVVSIFEPHTDIIVKDRRDTYFGHKIALTGGASGLFTDLVVLEGNPADSTLAVDMATRQKEIYNRLPLKITYDGGFASAANLTEIKELGIQDVAFSKKRGLAGTNVFPQYPSDSQGHVIQHVLFLLQSSPESLSRHHSGILFPRHPGISRSNKSLCYQL